MYVSVIRDIDSATVPITRFNKGEANKIFAEVREVGVKAVLKNNKREAVIMSPQLYDAFLDTIDEYMLIMDAHRRLEADTGKHYTFAEVMKEAGITEEDLADGEEIEFG